MIRTGCARYCATHPRLVVIGAGWIGLEVAAAARGAGVAVDCLRDRGASRYCACSAPRCPRRRRPPRRARGDFRFGGALAEIRVPDGRAAGVRLGDGTVVDADAVLVAVGAAPEHCAGRAAGLGRGSRDRLRCHVAQRDPDIVAAGDVGRPLDPFYGEHIRVEHWADAVESAGHGGQPQCLAATHL